MMPLAVKINVALRTGICQKVGSERVLKIIVFFSILKKNTPNFLYKNDFNVNNEFKILEIQLKYLKKYCLFHILQFNIDKNNVIYFLYTRK